LTVDMPRKLPLFVQRERSRHGRAKFFFRRGKGPRIRLPDDLSSAEFASAYANALSGTLSGTVDAPNKERPSDPKSFRWLVDRYRESAVWKGLSKATRYQRDHIFARTIDTAGSSDYREIDRKAIQRALDKRAGTPAQARITRTGAINAAARRGSRELSTTAQLTGGGRR